MSFFIRAPKTSLSSPLPPTLLTSLMPSSVLQTGSPSGSPSSLAVFPGPVPPQHSPTCTALQARGFDLPLPTPLSLAPDWTNFHSSGLTKRISYTQRFQLSHYLFSLGQGSENVERGKKEQKSLRRGRGSVMCCFLDLAVTSQLTFQQG